MLYDSPSGNSDGNEPITKRALMMNAADQHHVTGKISATPNPAPPGVGRVTISWESNDVNAEVRVATEKSKERLVSKGAPGRTEVSWIAEGKVYDFRLYGTRHPETPLDSVTVSRSPQALNVHLATVANQLACDTLDNLELAEFIAGQLICHCCQMH